MSEYINITIATPRHAAIITGHNIACHAPLLQQNITIRRVAATIRLSPPASCCHITAAARLPYIRLPSGVAFNTASRHRAASFDHHAASISSSPPVNRILHHHRRSRRQSSTPLSSRHVRHHFTWSSPHHHCRRHAAIIIATDEKGRHGITA